MRLIDSLIIHHSAGNPAQTVDSIDQMHRDRGFSQIGYHYAVTADIRPEVVACRPLNRGGAHARGRNKTSIGVVALGWNGDPGRLHWGWTENQVMLLQRFVDATLLLFPSIQWVGGHRDTGAATLCPGLDVYDVLEIPADRRRPIWES